MLLAEDTDGCVAASRVEKSGIRGGGAANTVVNIDGVAKTVVKEATAEYAAAGTEKPTTDVISDEGVARYGGTDVEIAVKSVSDRRVVNCVPAVDEAFVPNIVSST